MPSDASCLDSVTYKFGAVDTKEAISAYFGCFDVNNDGKITAEEACSVWNCGQRGSNVTLAHLKKEFQQMGDSSTDYITPAEFDAKLKDGLGA